MKHRFVKLMVHIIFSFVLNSCALTVLFPGSLNQRPDVSGKTLGGDINIGLENFMEVTVFDDITSNPPTRVLVVPGGASAPSLKTFFPYLPVVNYNIGIVPALDIYATGHYGLKFQFLGQRNQEGWKAAVFGGLGTNNSSISEVSCTGGTCSGEVKLSGMEYGLSFGKGLSPNAVVYITAGQQKGDAKTKIKQPTQTFEYDDKYEHTIVTLGFEFGEKLYFTPEISHTTNTWSTSTTSYKKSGTTGLVAVGLKW